MIFYRAYNVLYCSAGDEHSAVLIRNITINKNINNNNNNNNENKLFLKIVSTFGCGYYGRLGNGSNRNTCVPVMVSKWSASMQELQIRCEKLIF